MTTPDEHSRFSPAVITLLATAAVLLAGNIYFAVKTDSLEKDVSGLRNSLKAEVAATQSAIKAANAERDRALSELQKTVEVSEAKSQQAAATATMRARRYTDELARKLSDQHSEKIESTTQQLQQSSQSAHQQLSQQIGQMRQTATETSAQVSGIATEVSTVKTAVASTKSELDRILADMRSVRGDLGVQSGLIATNSKELAALRALGERDYFEFQLQKTKTPQRIGEVAMLLKKLDTKRNRFSLDLIADDKKVEKKDRTINEPVQFYRNRIGIPYEIVVNSVNRDKIAGYLSAPKVKQPQVLTR